VSEVSRKLHRAFVAAGVLAGTSVVALSLLGAAHLEGWFSSAGRYGTFVEVADMTTARWNPTATRLVDGRVLVSGGVGNGVGYELGDGPTLRSAELFDPATNTFTATGSMSSPRSHAVSSILPDGRVLVAGGNITTSADVYDPKTGQFVPTGSLTHPRIGALSVALADGRILVVGGNSMWYGLDSSAEVYDPATGTFSPTGSLLRIWTPSSATLLRDGRVLVAGGVDESGVERVPWAELYDPTTGKFTETGPLMTAQDGAGMLLADGRVLVAGGCGNDLAGAGDRSAAEIYDPSTGSFKRTGSMTTTGCSGRAVPLATGFVLVLGWDAEVYEPATGTFHWVGYGDVYGSSVALLADGRVLVAGGWSEDDHAPALAFAELYLP
jgi:hypothetical protein